MMSSNPSRKTRSLRYVPIEDSIVREHAQWVEPYESNPAYIAAQNKLAEEEKSPAEDGEVEDITAPKAEKDKHFGVPRRVVNKAQFMAIRPLGLNTTIFWGTTDKSKVYLTEDEARVWHQMEGTVYERKKGGSAELDEQIKKNLERHQKRIQRLISKGIQKHRLDEVDWEDGALKEDGPSTEDEAEDGKWVEVSKEGKVKAGMGDAWVKC